MIACIMGNMETVNNIVTVAREKLSAEDFALFINVQIERD